MKIRPLPAVAVFQLFGTNQRETHPAFFAITSSAPFRTSSMSSDSFSRLHKGNDFSCVKAIPGSVVCTLRTLRNRQEFGSSQTSRQRNSRPTVISQLPYPARGDFTACPSAVA
jgi:hypothetical protein